MDKEDVMEILGDLGPKDIIFITTLGNRNYISGDGNIDTTKITWFIPARIQVVDINGRGPMRLNGFFRIPMTEIGSITRLAA